jgi:hypothetical protein
MRDAKLYVKVVQKRLKCKSAQKKILVRGVG